VAVAGEEIPDKEKPNFAPTGLLAAATKSVAQADGTAIVLKYHEPPEARKPSAKDVWKLFVFKGSDIVETIELSLRTCWLVGREVAVVDMPAEHHLRGRLAEPVGDRLDHGIVEHRTLGDWRPGLGEDSVLLAVAADVIVEQVRMQLDLVDRRHHVGLALELLQMLDLDEVSLPDEMSVVSDPEVCVKWAVDHLLPPEFGDASFVYQLSSSAGLTKLENELNVHLWFITEQSYGNDNLRAWGRWWNAKQQRKIIDPALFTSVQPHYTSAPELLDELIDPLASQSTESYVVDGEIVAFEGEVNSFSRLQRRMQIKDPNQARRVGVEVFYLCVRLTIFERLRPSKRATHSQKGTVESGLRFS